MKTTIFYLRQLLVLFAVMLAFSACDDDNDDAAGGDITVITPSNNAITCGGTVKDPFTISFTATGDWTARPSHGWLSLSKMTGGAGDHTIILIVSDNDNFDKSRVGTITITDKVSKKSVDILVTQGAKNAELTFSSKSQEGMELEIISDLKEPANNRIEGSVDVASNYDYRISLDKDWLGYQTTKNDDGSTNINFRVTDYDKLYNDGGYSESTCTVSFVYASQTRAANTVTYKVKFPGVTPYLEFYVSNEEEAEAVSSIELEEGDYIYKENEEDTEFITIHTYLKSAVYIKSNIAWENVESDKFLFEKNSAKNNSSTFFDSNTSVKVVLKEMTLDDIDDNISFTDKKNPQEPFGKLNVTVKGLGNDYVFLDWSVFQPVDQITNHFMFEAEGEYGMESKMDFVVKTTNPKNEKVYAFNVSPNFHYNTQGILKQEADWITLWDPDGYYESEGVLSSGTWTIKLPNRGTDENSDYYPDKPRFFALVAVPKSITIDDLFDADEYLKEEYENNCVILGQKGKVSSYEFTGFYNDEPLEEGQEIQLSSSAKNIVISYSITPDLDADQGIGLGLYRVSEIFGEGQEDWDGTLVDLNDKDFSAEFKNDQVIIKVNENAGQERTVTLGLAVSVGDKTLLVRTIVIKQAGATK